MYSQHILVDQQVRPVRGFRLSRDHHYYLQFLVYPVRGDREVNTKYFPVKLALTNKTVDLVQENYEHNFISILIL